MAKLAIVSEEYTTEVYSGLGAFEREISVPVGQVDPDADFITSGAPDPDGSIWITGYPHGGFSTDYTLWNVNPLTGAAIDSFALTGITGFKYGNSVRVSSDGTFLLVLVSVAGPATELRKYSRTGTLLDTLSLSTDLISNDGITLAADDVTLFFCRPSTAIASNTALEGISRDPSAWFDPTQSWTKFIRCRFSGAPESDYRTVWVLKSDETYILPWVGLFSYPDINNLYFQVGDGDDYLNIPADPPNSPPEVGGVWRDVAVVYDADATRFSFYLDGYLIGHDVWDNSEISPFTDERHGSDGIVGTVGVEYTDERLWQRALSATEIRAERASRVVVDDADLLSASALESTGDIDDQFGGHDWTASDIDDTEGPRWLSKWNVATDTDAGDWGPVPVDLGGTPHYWQVLPDGRMLVGVDNDGSIGFNRGELVGARLYGVDAWTILQSYAIATAGIGANLGVAFDLASNRVYVSGYDNSGPPNGVLSGFNLSSGAHLWEVTTFNNASNNPGALMAIAGGASEDSFTIDGVERPILQRWQIHTQLNERGTMNFGVKSMDASYRPGLREPIDFQHFAQHLFAGNIHHKDEAGLGGYGVVPIVTQCGATDFKALAERRKIVGTLTLDAGTLKSQIHDLAEPLEVYGVTVDPGQVDGPSMPELVLTGGSIFDGFQKLSVQSGYAFDVDYDKVLRMFEPGVEDAPFNIEEGDSRVKGDVRVSPTTVDYGNHVTVRFTKPAETAFVYFVIDNNPSDDTKFKVSGREFVFKVTPTDANHIQIGATINDTYNNFVAAVDPLDEVTAFNQTTRVDVYAAETGAAGNSIQVESNDGNDGADFHWTVDGVPVASHLYYGSDPVLSGVAIAEDIPAQEGGANLYELVFSHPEVENQDAADSLAEGYLARSLVTPREIRYRTRLHGLKVGQKQHITKAGRNVDADCLITQIEISPEGSALLNYDVTAIEGLVIVASHQEKWRQMQARAA